MRRQLLLDDYSPPTLSYNICLEGNQAPQHKPTSTDQFKMKDIKVETIIRNSQTNDSSFQVSAGLIQKQLQEDMLKSHIQHNEVEQEIELHEQILKKVDRFLRKVVPLMNRQLEENLPSYNSFANQNTHQFFKRQSRLVHTLQNVQGANQDKLQISCICWNASGVILGAGYAKFDHDSSCSHKSYVSLWGLYKRNFKPTKPEIIQVPNCVNCISFHPKKPAIFAIGSYVGQILLYDFSRREESLLGKTIVDDYFHKDCITKISWWAYRPPGKIQTNYNLLSLASDGKILLWELPNQAFQEDAKNKTLLKYPLKGFLMLRKKQNVIIPVSGLTMCQSLINKNIFIVGSEGGSILRATLAPINHHANNEAKILLDMQTSIKFKPQVYPFLLNLLPKNVRQIKAHVEKVCSLNKIDNVDSIATILNTRPELRNLYPNPITYAYEALAYPVSSISYNRYGLFIANAGDGYTRIYSEQQRENLESIEEGYEWAWINGSSKIGGLIEQEFVVMDWVSGQVIWSIGVGQGLSWCESSLGMIGVICEKTKVKIIELGDKIMEQSDLTGQRVGDKIDQLLSKEAQ